MLFGQPGADRPLTVVDWQTVVWGPAMTDVAYFLGGALPERLRRDHYDALLRRTTKRSAPKRRSVSTTFARGCDDRASSA